MRKIFRITIYFVLLINFVKAQDPQFTQFYANPLYLAPSFAGSTDADRVSLNYRIQWPELGNSFTVYTLSYDHYFPLMKSGLGFLFLRDEAGSGSLATTNIGMVYSYNLKLYDKWHFRPGLQFLYTQRSVDFDEFIFGDDIINEDTEGTAEPPTMSTKADIDATVSALFHNDIFWIGGTVDHLLTPNRSLTGGESYEPMKYSVYGGAKFVLRRKYRRKSTQSISPAFLFRLQDEYSQLDLGMYWYHMPIVIGIWYRGIPVLKDYATSDAVAFLLGYKLDNINIGYSYDLTVSDLIGFSGGTHEITINFMFNPDATQRSRRRAIPCPNF